MPIIKLTKVEQKRFLALVTCLFLAVGAWLFMALNNKYVYTAKTVLDYRNFPQKKAFPSFTVGHRRFAGRRDGLAVVVCPFAD
jgi:hypothetical protein